MIFFGNKSPSQLQKIYITLSEVVVVVVVVVVVYVADVVVVVVDLISEFHHWVFIELVSKFEHRIHPGEPTVRITERFDVQEVNILSIFNTLYSTLQEEKPYLVSWSMSNLHMTC